ncbi:hypothetical protein H2203_001506 [Taxawa tesnikishii (nom. ined.)]|nr:hypothetical protein H2203_001506 [Dothideales sp. JES 119]
MKGVLELPPQVPWDMVLQPDAGPISRAQFAAQFYGICAGLVRVEAKCMNIDNAQMAALRESESAGRSTLDAKQWQALVALHLTLLYEHHNLLLASQHPFSSSSSAWKRLAAEEEAMRDREAWLEATRSWYYGTTTNTSQHPSRRKHTTNCDLEVEGSKQARLSNCVVPSLTSKYKYTIEGCLAMIKVSATADTGSDLDIISASFARKHSLTVDKRTAHTFRLPSRRSIRSTGTVSLPFSFAGEKSRYERVFHVIENCVHDVILGRGFLNLTETLTKFAKRITKKLSSPLKRLQMCLLDAPSQRVWGSINGRSVSALPDTGSDLLIMSRRFAESAGFTITMGGPCKTCVQFADGSYAYTSGVVLGADWRFSRDESLKGRFKGDFHILDDFPFDVVLSNELLFDTEAFSQFGHCFFDVPEDPLSFERMFELSVIREGFPAVSQHSMLTRQSRTSD